jgi:hypothetical protein
MTRNFGWPRLSAVLVGLASALFLWPIVTHPAAFPVAPGSSYSDLLITHLANARFVHRAVVDWGQIPLWNPTLLSGMPFAADPLSGLWYPPLWLLAALPSAPIVNLIFWAHLALGGWGMVLLLRSEGLGLLPALAGGLAFAGSPKLVGHVGLGHLTLVSAVCWSPWVLFAVGRAVGRSGGERDLRAFLVAGALSGLVFLADPRWFPPVLLTALGYGAWRWIGRTDRSGRSTTRLLAGAAAGAVGLVAVAAALAVPLAEFTRLSTRAELTAESSNALALPAARLTGLVVALPGTWAEWTVAMGAVVLVLTAVACVATPRRAAFWIVLALSALVLALGAATPAGKLAAALPLANLIRVPARWLFLVGLALAALAAHGLSAINGEVDPARARRIRLAALFTGTLVLVLSLALSLAGGEPVWESSLFAVLAVAGVLLRLRGPRFGWVATALTVLLVVELFSIDVTLIEARPEGDLLAHGRSVASALADETDGRVFSPSYAVPQEAAAEAGLELADGVHPLQLSAYVTYMSQAVGFDPTTYSVTLPPFPSGDPSEDWGPALDAEALGFLAVARIASTYPITASGLTDEGEVDGVLLYRNEQVRPMAWVEGGNGQSVSAQTVRRTANRIELEATGPGRLVASDLIYPGWQATVDGQPTQIEPYRGLLRSVPLEAGPHSIVFSFVPSSLLAGMAVAGAAVALAIVLWRRR